MLLAFSMGMAWHILWANNILQDRLPHDLEGVDIVASGKVLSIPTRSGIARQFEFLIQNSDPGFDNRMVVLNYYGEELIEPGQQWQFVLRLNRPHGLYNPGSNDYEAQLFRQGVSAKGYVRSAEAKQLAEARSYLPLALTETDRIRFWLKSNIERTLGASANIGPVLALSIGDRSRIESSQWDLYNNTGTTHLFVISGLHIGLISVFGISLVSILMRLAPRLTLYYPRQKIAAIAALLFALAYSLLAGLSMPTQRALVMIAVFALAYLFDRKSSMSFRYFFSMSVVLSLDPLSIQSGGFWFSFAAVAFLLISGGLDMRSTRQCITRSDLLISRLFVLLRSQLYVFLGLSFLLLAFGAKLSLLAPLINLLAIPLLGFLIVPLCIVAMAVLLIIPSKATFFYKVLDWLLTLLHSSLERLMDISFNWSVIEYSYLSLATLVAGYILIAILLLPAGVFRRSYVLIMSMLLLATLFMFSSGKTRQTNVEGLEIHVLDVGQGLSVLLRTENYSLLYDVGARLSDNFDLGDAIVAPALLSLGVKSLDHLLVSHSDNDHAGGLSGLLSRIPVSNIISNNPSNYSVDSAACRRGDLWVSDDVTFEILHPHILGEKENNNSCVLKISFGEFSLLLPGDIEIEAERELAAAYGEHLQSAVIVAAHHGSTSSSGYGFLKRVMPEYVIFSAGYRNSFSHPHDSIQERFREFSAIAFNSSETGMLSFEVAKSGEITSINTFRAKKPRYWH